MKPILHQAIHITFKPSYLMLGLLMLVSSLCVGVLLNLPIAGWLKLGFCLLVIVSSVYFCLRDALLKRPNSWQSLTIDTKGELTIINQHGESFKPTLADSSLIHRNMIVLNFKRHGITFLPPAILLTTSENAEDLRHLRVCLLWMKPKNQAPDLAVDVD